MRHEWILRKRIWVRKYPDRAISLATLLLTCILSFWGLRLTINMKFFAERQDLYNDIVMQQQLINTAHQHLDEYYELPHLMNRLGVLTFSFQTARYNKLPPPRLSMQQIVDLLAQIESEMSEFKNVHELINDSTIGKQWYSCRDDVSMMKIYLQSSLDSNKNAHKPPYTDTVFTTLIYKVIETEKVIADYSNKRGEEIPDEMKKITELFQGKKKLP